MSPRLQRLKLKLVKYDLVLKYSPGKSMYVADWLSRTCKNECSSRLDLETNVSVIKQIIPHELPISEQKKTEFQECTENDPALKLV